MYFSVNWLLVFYLLFNLLYARLQGKSQIVQDELSKLGDQMVESAEGTRAVALQLCREFEDKFLQHIATGEVSNIGFLLTSLLLLWWMPISGYFSNVHNNFILVAVPT